MRGLRDFEVRDPKRSMPLPWLLLGCCWETFYIFAYCGLEGNPTTELLKLSFLLPFQRQPSYRKCPAWVVGVGGGEGVQSEEIADWAMQGFSEIGATSGFAC